MNLPVIWPQSGCYILAVSGGADSMALLDLFAGTATERSYELVVAHFDHGLRSDSPLDRQLVGEAAARYGLPFETVTAKLAAGSSEAAARTARHAWLEQIRAKHAAAAILTAHHQDDLLETSLLNLARGSGRLGLAPMAPTATIARPLLNMSRKLLRNYVIEHQIHWREDSTNADATNPRNFLRHKLLTNASISWRTSYLENISELAILNTKIDQSISDLLNAASPKNEEFTFVLTDMRTMGPEEIGELILAAARHLRPGIQLDSRLVREAVNFVQTGAPKKSRPLRSGLVLSLTRDFVNIATKPPR